VPEGPATVPPSRPETRIVYTPIARRKIAAYFTMGVCAGWTFGGITVTNSVPGWFVTLIVLCSFTFVIGLFGWL
jgi:hypothetical protein